MPRFDTPPCSFRLIVMMAVGFFFLAAAGGAVAKNGGNSNDHGGKTSEKYEIKSKNKSISLKAVRKDTASKDKPRHSDKKDKKKDKAPGKSADKPKDKDSVTVISGGFVRDKLPNGTVYYRRATKAELENAAKSNGGTTTGIPTAGNSPVPAKPAPGSPPPATVPTADNGPVVRDHRPGGNSVYPAPGTIIRDHRNGADGTPMVVVKAGPTGTVTRRATDADLKKAGLQKPDEPGLLDKVGHALNNLPGAAKAGPSESTSTSTQQ